MTKKTRLAILILCIACFFAVAPILVAYSIGYRFDFKSWKIVETGGIYVRTFPPAEEIIIDSKFSNKPGFFSNAVFVQSLLPKEHTVYIKKKGYFDYLKTLTVREKEVTKLENVILIKESLNFNKLFEKIDYFSISPNNKNIITATVNAKAINLSYSLLNSANHLQTLSIPLTGKISEIKWYYDSTMALIKIQVSNNIYYYLFDDSDQTPKITRLSYLDKNSEQISFNPQNGKNLFYIKNKTLYSLLVGETPKIIITNVLAYKISGNKIYWLSNNGTLLQSDISGKLVNELSEKDVNLNKKYEIIIISEKIFLKENNLLFLFNHNTKKLENFNSPNFQYVILGSPDDKNIIYCSDDEIYIYSFLEKKYKKIFSGNKIGNCQWVNNDYIIFTSGDKIIISEIDYRGNINAITLPQTLYFENDQIIEIRNPQILFFVWQSGKIYVLTDNILLESEKVTP